MVRPNRAGGDEFAAGVWKVKDMAKREEASVPEADVPATVQAALAPTRG